MAEQTTGRRSGHGVSREPVPALADDPILERLDRPPPLAPKASETAHDKARRQLIAQPGQWMVLKTRAKSQRGHRPPDGPLLPASQTLTARPAGHRPIPGPAVRAERHVARSRVLPTVRRR